MSFTESLEEIVKANASGLLAAHPTWGRVRLGDACEILNGFAFKSQYFNQSEGTPLIRIRDVLRGETETLYNGDYDSTYVVEPGDLVVGMDGDFNCALWGGRTALLNQRVCRLRPDEHVLSLRFLAYVLQGYLDAINAKTSAITVKHLSSRTLADVPLPLPPRQMQTRIADRLDELLSDLRAASDGLERVQRNLTRYRASVLQAAVEGRLVPTDAELARAEGRDYEPASELLERILAERRRRWEEAELEKLKAKGKTPKDDRWKKKYKEPVAPDTTELPELPEGWCWASADQLCSLITDGEHITPERSGEGVLLLSARNVQNGYLSLDVVDYIPEYEYERIATRLEVTAGDVLLSCSGTVGRSCTVPRGLRFALVRSVAVLRPVVKMDRFLTLSLRSPLLQGQIARRKTQTAQANIFQGKIKQLVFALPPSEEQQRIEEEVQDLLERSEHAAGELATSHARCSRLRASILAWAFEGKLVDQDPDDEPAAVLLERIRKSREADGGKTTAPRRARRKKR